MTQTWQYKDAFGASDVFEVDLGQVVRLGEIQGLSEVAEHLNSGTTSVTFDDPDANLGNGGDAILGMQRIKVTEDAMVSGNQRLYTGILGTRTYSRRPGTSLISGVARQIACELHDLNSLMSLRAIPPTDRDAIRPRESVTDRMAWILSTNYMNGVVASSIVDANATQMTKADYRNQRPSNVVNDCEMAAGFGWNAFVKWNETDAVPDLVFFNANTSTDYSSTLRISNVLGDVDTMTPATFLTGTTFAPIIDADLRRDPDDVGDEVNLPFKNSALSVTRAATTAIYGHKTIMAPNSNVTQRDRALDQANEFAFQHSTEEDRISVTVELPPNKVNLIRAGMRIEVKFQHLPGYESFTWCRVLERAAGQTKPTDDRYFMRLELSPQEAGAPEPPCSEDGTPDGTYYPLGNATPGTGPDPNVSDGVVYYFRGGLSLPSSPTPGWQGQWHFPLWGAGGVGTIDYFSTCTGSSLVLMTVGNGTWTIQTETEADQGRTLNVSVGPYYAWTFQETITPGDSVEVTIDDTGDGDCFRFVVLDDFDSEGACGKRMGWSSATWVGA